MNPTLNILDLFKCHPSLLDGDKIREVQFKRPYKVTFVFAQPRSGSTLLMRLMNMACASPMSGDRPFEFYRGLLDVASAMKIGQVGHLFLAEERGEFWDQYQCANQDRLNYLIRNVVHIAFGCANYMSNSAKTTVLGFGNDLVSSFANMLRESFGDRESEYDFKIVFLTRNIDDIITSLQTREGPGQQTAQQQPEIVRDLLEKQLAQFREAHELGDAWLTYDKLVNETEASLKKCNPIYPPNLPAMKSILSKIIR